MQLLDSYCRASCHRPMNSAEGFRYQSGWSFIVKSLSDTQEFNCIHTTVADSCGSLKLLNYRCAERCEEPCRRSRYWHFFVPGTNINWTCDTTAKQPFCCYLLSLLDILVCVCVSAPAICRAAVEWCLTPNAGARLSAALSDPDGGEGEPSSAVRGCASVQNKKETEISEELSSLTTY